MLKRDFKLLVIEDNLQDFQQLQAVLAASMRISAVVTRAAGLREALTTLDAQQFDVVITELNLPDAAGVEVIDQLNQYAPGLPVIVLSHIADEKLVVEALQKGAEDYVLKSAMKLAVFEHTIPYSVERSRAAEQLKETERAHHTLMNNLPGMVYRCKNDAAWTMEIVSENCEKLTGYRSEDLVGNRSVAYADLIHLDDRQRVLDSVQAGLQARSLFNLSYRIVTADGQLKHVWEQGQGVFSPGGALLAIEGYIVDITSNWQMLQAFDESQQQLKALANSFGDIVYTLDGNQQIDGAFGRWVDAMNLSPDDLLGKTSRDIFGEEQAAAHATAQAAALNGEYIVYEWTANHSDDKRFYETSLSPIYSEDRRVTGVAAIGRDITTRRQREREQQATLNLAAAMRAGVTQQELLPAILQETMRVLDCQSAAFGMYDEINHLMVIEYAMGDWQDFAGRHMPIRSNGLLDQALDTSQPLYLDPNDVENIGPIPDIIRKSGKLACAPLVANGEVLGLLMAGKKYSFNAEDRRIFEVYANLSANAIHRATLLEETARRLKYVHGLHEIDQSIIAREPIQAILEKIIAMAREQLHLDAVQIVQIEAHGRQLRLLSQAGLLHPPANGKQVRLAMGPLELAENHRRLIPDLRQHPQFVEARGLGDERFVSYLGFAMEVDNHHKGLFEVLQRTPLRLSPAEVNLLETLAGQASIALDKHTMSSDLQKKHHELMEAYESTIEGWSRTLELRDDDTVGHSNRVTAMTLRLARELAIDDEELVHIRRGALLHDIGKMGVPDAILYKNDSLNEEEWSIMRTHPALAYERLKPIKFLEPALSIPFLHHERWDGSGYPLGLKGSEIPLAARIFAVVDVWDALTSDRPYRSAWPQVEARNYIRSMAGIHFDPQVVEAFFRVVDG